MASGKHAEKKKPRRKSPAGTARERKPIDPIERPCICVDQRGKKAYVFAVSGKTLWSVVQIDQRQEDKDEGYQRALSMARVAKIAEYVEAGNRLPGAVQVSFDKATVNATGTSIRIEGRHDAGWIIDGQHRLAGVHRAAVDTEMVVVAYLGLPLSEQIELFVTINREQKGVPSSLYYDLLRKLPQQLSVDDVLAERANSTVTALKSDPASPFYRRIKVTTAPKPGQLSSTNVIRKLKPHLRRDGRLAALSDAERAGVMNNLYQALRKVFPKEYERRDSIFFQTLGFGAFMGALPVIMDVTATRAGGKLTFSVPQVERTLRLLESFDFLVWRDMGTGSAAEKSASDELRERLLDELKAVHKGPNIEL